MIREEDIREFQEIIEGRNSYDSEIEGNNNEEFDLDDEFLDAHEGMLEEDEEESSSKQVSGNTLVLFITGTFGLTFLIFLIVLVLTFIYGLRDGENVRSNKKNGNDNLKSSQIWRFPGYKPLVTDPKDSKVKVWGVRTAVPPEPCLDLYFYFMYPEMFEEPKTKIYLV